MDVWTEDVQSQPLIPALNALAAQVKYTSACQIATQIPEHGRMNDLTTEHSFGSQVSGTLVR